MDEKKKKVIDIIQWILIIFLLFVCGFIYFKGKTFDIQKDIDKNENTYIKIYDSQKIKELEKINKELNDSIKSLENAESALKIEYRYIYKTDTIRVNDFKLKDDSIYHYHNDNDTLTTDIKIKAKSLEWVTVNSHINNKFVIITQKEGNKVKTIINHDNNTEIKKIDAWRKKDSFKDRIYYGPSVGIGYGTFNRKVDLYVGFSVGYKF